ncbi:MAG TPA: MtrB/PioB family outer membrane beta-barrel protein [Thermoanaerobaculia bacterium]|nr:MtrB/PioB family outer membrane beta-barrel protein [Thermoanaerobaculia bacterium]
MKRSAGIALALSAVASFALGQAETAPHGFTLGRIDFGVQTTDVDTDSSKFREYRELPNGPVLSFLRLFGDHKVRYDVIVENGFENDARYRVSADLGRLRIAGDYNLIPHRFGNDGHTLLHETSRGVLVIDDTIQRANQNALEAQFAANRSAINFPFLSNLVAPQLAAANEVDVGLLRRRGTLEVGLTPDQPFDVKVSYFQEHRTGDRQAGTSFGFGNVVESLEPIEYRTEDWGISAEFAQPWGLVRGAAHYNTFENEVDSLLFDNPFRVTDSTDGNAYQAPGTASVNGPTRGRVDLSPDNEAVTGSLGVVLRIPVWSGRVTADASTSRWTQNRKFLPYTVNTAITSPFRADDPANLPASSLDGEIDVSTLSVSFTSRPTRALGLTARYRVYDLSNDTTRIEFPGYVRFDAVWEEIPRISVPYGYKRTLADAVVSYDFGPATVEGGYRYVGFDRTFRETTETTENVLTAALSLRAFGWAMLRAGFETGDRDRDAYDSLHGEEASFLDPGPGTNLPALRRFDQARRDIDRVTALLQVTPGGGDLTVSLSYLYANEDYGAEEAVDASGLLYGLIETSYDTFTAEADYSPSDRWSLFGFYTREEVDNFQRGRQSAATPSADPRNDWTSAERNEVSSFGGGANVTLLPEKLELKLFGRYQDLEGRNDIASPPGGTPDVAFSIPNFDDTRIWTARADLEYRFSGPWSVTAGGWLERYEVDDSATTGLGNYVPGSFFIAANDGSYKGKVGYVRMSYRW